MPFYFVCFIRLLTDMRYTRGEKGMNTCEDLGETNPVFWSTITHHMSHPYIYPYVYLEISGARAIRA